MFIEDDFLRPYFIEVDSNNFIVKKRYTTDKGEPAETTIGYYSKFENAIMRIVRDAIPNRDEKATLVDFLKKWVLMQESLYSRLSKFVADNMITKEYEIRKKGKR